MSEKTPLQIKLEEQMQLLIPREDAPESLKKEVFRTLDFLGMLGEVSELFTAKFGEAGAEFLGLLGEDEEEEE